MYKKTSENRRILKKVVELDITASFDARDDALFKDASFLDFCSRYANSRFSGAAMSLERLKYVVTRSFIYRTEVTIIDIHQLSRPILTHVITFRSAARNNCVLGYVVCCVDKDILHYWFSFSLFLCYFSSKLTVYLV